MYIKTALLLTCLSILPFLLSAQDSSNDQLQILFSNWERLHHSEKYEAALEQADAALQLAQKLVDKKSMAKALNCQGKTLIKNPKRVNKNRKLAKEKFEESMLYLARVPSNDLRIDNLEHLQFIATQEGAIEQASIYRK